MRDGTRDDIDRIKDTYDLDVVGVCMGIKHGGGTVFTYSCKGVVLATWKLGGGFDEIKIAE